MKLGDKQANKQRVRVDCDYCGKSIFKSKPLKCRGFVICSECIAQETVEFKDRFINKWRSKCLD